MDFFVTIAVVAVWFGALFLAVMLVLWLASLPGKRRERREEARRREMLGG